MNAKRNPDRAAGFTLIEALISIAILAIGLMAVVTMIDVAFSAGTLSRNTTKATQLATWMMDRIKQETWNVNQTYTSDVTRIRSFDNDSTSGIAVDTTNATNPAEEPGATAVREWRALIQGADIAGYISGGALAADMLPPDARGEVKITT